MRKFYILLFAIIVMALPQANAQTSLTQAVDFTVTDVQNHISKLWL